MAAVVIPFSLSWMTYNPLVQTFLARMASSYLSNKLNTVITIEGLHITPRLDINVMGVLALDQRNDTLFHAGDISIDMKSFRFQQAKKVFELNDMYISDASLSLVKNVNDSAFTYSFIRDHFQSTTAEQEVDTILEESKWQVSLNALELDNVRFRFTDETKDKRDIGMDYTDLDIFVYELRLHDLEILNDTFNFGIERLRCYDKCGFVVDDLSGEFKLSPLYLVADNLKVLTPRSNLDLDLVFTYNGWPSYIKFIEEVEMSSEIRPSELNLVDIGYFAPDMLVMDNQMRVGGQVKGTVDNFRIKDFRFTYGQNTRFRGDIRLYGLPDVAETFIHTNVDEFVMTRKDIESFAIPGSYRYIPVPDELGVLGTMRIKGSFTGFYNDFVSKADFSSDIGLISTDISLRQNEDEIDVLYEGEVKARRFHIGKFLNLKDYFGTMDLEASIIGKGLTGESADIHITGNIDSLMFMQHYFNEVGVRGDIAENRFNGHIDVNDDLINFIFNGILDFNKEKPIFDFTANIKDADLFSLNLLDRDSLSLLSAKLNCNFIGFDPEDLEGRIRVDSLLYLEGEKTWFLEHLALLSLKDTGYFRKIMLTSDMMDAMVQGNFTIREMTHAVNNLLLEQFTEWAFLAEPDHDIRPQSLAFDLNIKETTDLLEIFVPGLYIQENGTITGSFSSEDLNAEVFADFPYANYQGISSDTIKIMAYAVDSLVSMKIATERIQLKEGSKKDTLELGLEKFYCDALLGNDSLLYAIGWSNQEAKMKNMADIRGYYTYIDSLKSELSFTTARAIINDSTWNLAEGNHLIFGRKYFELVDFNVYGGKQELKLHGKMTENPLDTMKVDFSNWRLSNFDIIFNNYNFDLNGIIDGSFGISSVYGLPNFYSGLYIAGLEMNDVLIGDADIRSSWNNERYSVDVLAEVIYHGNIEDSRVISITGSYFPLKNKRNLDFQLKLNNLRLEAFSSFTDGFISDLKGVASAGLEISGSTSNPKMKGQLKFMRTSCRIDYLNTRYSFAHTIDFNPGLISVHSLVVYDSIGNKATANGEITHRSFKDFYFNLNLKAEDFICLYTNRYHNQTFYGDGIASGDVKFYGTVENFHIDADLETSRGAMITIPLNNSFTVTENDFVVFLGQEKEEEELDIDDYSVDIKGLSLDFNIGINNTAEAMIILPGNMGNISSRGHGDIRFTVNPRGDFRIYGDYNFLGGTFFFSLQNLINRRFEILPGGSIGFTGNPFNADVNLKALYRLKTSLSGLGASISPEYEGQRVNVNAYLGLKGKLANPDIHFSIKFPNVREEIKTSIFAVLDTNDAMLMNQQMVSLLLMNSFSYASSSTNMSASSLNIVTSQLSNWLSQISRDFDIGINYIAGDEMNQDELEVALSTQFFDNRLIIDGNVGVMTSDRENVTTQHASNIVGDVNIEYKLRPDGRIRVKAFNRANNINTIDYYAPYTQGVGIFYTKEFDRFGDIFRRQRKKGESLEEGLEN